MSTNKKSQETDQPTDAEAEELVVQMGLSMGLTNGIVVKAFTTQLGHLDKHFSIQALGCELQTITDQVKDGDLQHLEAMLVTQAIALQSMFANLAARAKAAERSERHDSLLLLALKAQSHSRATMGTLADLKFPRQATFVKQTNIAQGAQQVNNSAEASNKPAAVENKPSPVLGLTNVNSMALPVMPRSKARAPTLTQEKSQNLAKQTIGGGG
jgi:hypothetical protein